MNQCRILIGSCILLGFLTNSDGVIQHGVGCGQRTLRCPCNEPLANKQFTINIKYCLTKTKACEPCDRITNTAKCKVYQNSCNNNNPNDISSIAPCHCLNGGTCVNDSEGTCICPQEFEGAFCEVQGQTEPPPTEPTSGVFCEMPDHPYGGYCEHAGVPIIPGEYIYYKCNQGYELYGNVTRYCQDSGNFDGVTPTCEKICRIPDMNYHRLNYVLNPNHQRENELVDRFGNAMITEIQFSCQDNFRLEGPHMIRCSNGVWDRKPPSCSWIGPSCKVPIIPSKMLIQVPEMTVSAFIPESVLSYKCINETKMKGDPMIVCSYSGIWVPQPPTCIQVENNTFPSPTSCQTPKTPQNCYIRTNIVLNAAVPGVKNDFTNYVPVHTQVTYECKEGFRLSTSEFTRTCLPDGKWNGKEPECISECGKTNVPISSYILNGNVTTINKWPWHVGLYTYENYKVFCGGSVLNEKWVLTAAHCVSFHGDGIPFQKLKYETYGVFFGHSTSNVNVSSHENLVKRKVWSVIVHQEFNRDTLDSDIALILLKTPLTFSKEIRPVCLPTFKSSATDIVNSAGFVVGWGMTDPNIEELSLQLRYSQVKMVPNDVCKDSNVNEFGVPAPISQNMFCADGIKAGGGTCQGDSGGSLCVKTGSKDNEVFRIEGIVSFGGYKGCGATGQYSGFTKVRNYVDWIQSFINH